MNTEAALRDGMRELARQEHMNEIVTLALDHGPDFDQWPAWAQERAVVALLRADEHGKPPNWLCDCLVEQVGCVDENRQRIVAALGLPSKTASETVIGEVVRDALLAFPQSWLALYVNDHYDDWLAAEREASEFRRDVQSEVKPLLTEKDHAA